MTSLGIAQILVFFLIVLAITKPIGTFMYRVFEGERTFLHPILPPVGAADLSCRRGARRRGAVLGSLLGVDDLAEHIQFPVRVPAAAIARTSAAQPDALFNAAGSFQCHADDAGFGVQHRRQLHDEHELAVLFSGHDDELSDADGCSRRPELCFRRGRNRRGRRADSRIRATHGEDDRKFLGGRDPLHALHPAADLHSGDAVFRLAGLHSELQRPGHRNDSGRHEPGDRTGSAGVAARHQDAGNERRRVFQREFSPSVRESNASVQPAPDAVDFFTGRRIDVHVRQDGA